MYCATNTCTMVLPIPVARIGLPNKKYSFLTRNRAALRRLLLHSSPPVTLVAPPPPIQISSTIRCNRSTSDPYSN